MTDDRSIWDDFGKGIEIPWAPRRTTKIDWDTVTFDDLVRIAAEEEREKERNA